MLQAPKQPKFFQKCSSFKKYLQNRKRPRKVLVKKIVLAQTFIKFKALQILPINKDCRFTKKIHELPCIFKTLEEATKECSTKELLWICGWNPWILLKFNFFADIFRNFWLQVHNNYNEEQHFAVHLFAGVPLDGCFWNVFCFLVAIIFQSSSVSLLLHLHSIRNYITNKLVYYWLFSLVGGPKFLESWLTYFWRQVSSSIAVSILSHC